VRAATIASLDGVSDAVEAARLGRVGYETGSSSKKRYPPGTPVRK
jgi:hypothetical protein